MCAGRSHIERGGGLHTSENAGMSSESEARILTIESLRFPGEGLSSQAKSGPKSRANAVDDGQLVDIPVPPQYDKESRQGRRRIAEPHGWRCVAKS
jgi:hypothetical protein